MLRPITRMGNLLSLYPKIHRLRANTKEERCLPDGQRHLVGNDKSDLSTDGAGIEAWHSYPLIWLVLILPKQTKCAFHWHTTVLGAEPKRSTQPRNLGDHDGTVNVSSTRKDVDEFQLAATRPLDDSR